MRKKLPILIIFFIVIIFVYLLVHILKKEHQVNYDLVVDKVKYKIEENYTYDKGIHNYDFIIEDNNKNIFNFNYEKDLNKKKKVIDKIIRYKKNKLVCILPKYIKDDIGNVYCVKNNKTYSYSYLRDEEDKDFKEIVKKIKKDGYKYKYLSVNNKTTKKNNITYYLKNVPGTYKFILWNYTGINVISRDGIETKKLVKENDMYENPYSTMVGKYYIFLNANNREKIDYYNILNKKMYSIKNKDETFYGDYIVLGIYNKKLYFIDTDKYIEYTLNPYNKKLEKIGDEKKGYITIKDRKELEVETSDLKNNPDNYKFVSKVKDDIISDNYNAKDIYYYNGFYYYRSNDNYFYRSYSKYRNKATCLFKLKDVNYWTIIGNDILIITNKYMYYYNDNYGLKKIVKNEEFKYNYNNIGLVYSGN